MKRTPELQRAYAMWRELVANRGADLTTMRDAVEDFYRPRHLYQLTAEGEAAERAIEFFEGALKKPGELRRPMRPASCREAWSMINSAPLASRGIRPNSLSQSSLPRSAISARVFSCATITSASNADAPSTRTA